MTNSNKTPYTTLFNSFKRHIKTLTASLEEKDFNSLFKSLDAFKSHQAENRKLNQLLFSQVRAYLNYVNDISTWFTNDDALSTLIAQRNGGNGGNGNTGSSGSNGSISNTGYTYVFSEAYEILKLVGVTPLYSKPLISEYLYHVSINSGLPFADETILNSSEQIRKDVNDEVDKFVDCEFSVLIANLVLFLDFAAMYTGKKAAGKKAAGSKVAGSKAAGSKAAVNKGNNKSNKSAGKSSGKSVSAGKSAGNNTKINEDGAEVAEVAEAKEAKDNVFGLDGADGANTAEIAGYQDAINWLNSFIETKAGLAKLRAKVWETLTSGHSVEFLDYSRRATEPPSIKCTCR